LAPLDMYRMKRGERGLRGFTRQRTDEKPFWLSDAMGSVGSAVAFAHLIERSSPDGRPSLSPHRHVRTFDPLGRFPAVAGFS
jgi:hypothetical protein